MKECEKVLEKWLSDAYTMEKSIAGTLRGHADDARDTMLDLAMKLEEHAKGTEDQAEKIKNALEDLGGDISELKVGASEVMGILEGKMSLGDDKVVRNTIMEHAVEHFEMATYMAIARAARLCDHEEIAELAEEIMEEEKETGKMFADELNQVVEEYISSKNEEASEEE